MAEIKWTEEQLEAISSSGEALLVSAAAGSGKTTVLIEKLKRLLVDSSNDISADNIVVVTFTNEAAAQMKNRLHKELTDAMTDPELEDETGYISEQLSLLPSANISTIHSFCFRLIRENAGILGIDPGFGIAEPSDEDTLVIKAVDNVFEQMYTDSEKTRKIEKLLAVFCPNDKDPSGLKDIIRKLRIKLLALPFPENFAEKCTENYLRAALDEDDIIKAYAKLIYSDLEKAYMYSSAAVRYVSENAGCIPDKKREELINHIIKDNDAIEEILDLYEEKLKDPVSVLEAEDIYFDRFNVCSFELEDGTNAHDILKKELIEKYRSICSDYLNVYIIYKGQESHDETTPRSLFTHSQIKNDYRIHAEISELLFDIISDVREEEKRLKAERNILGFSDAEQYACELLCEKNGNSTIPSALALELQKKYRLIMVDEFQDSTKIQELIFRMISDGGNAEKAGKNFFAVGDIKQSIYRFRAAEPSLFENNLNDPDLKKVYLNRNYRSASPVVDFVNRSFEKIMSVRNGGINYGVNDALIYGEKEKNTDLTEIITVTAEMAEMYDADTSAAYQKAEDDAVALRVKHMIDSGVKPSDICLLMRANKQMKNFAESFARLDIPYEYSASDSILKTGEVRTILDLLRIIDNPTLDIPFAAVLMSPLFAFTADDLASIRLSDKTQTLYGDLLIYSENDDPLAAQCKEFRDMFSTFREYSMTHTSGEMIDYIYQKTYAISIFSVYPDGAQKVSNLRRFSSAAAAYDQTSPGTGRNIGSFIRRMNVLEDNNSDIAGEDISSGQAVMMKTLHKSKGLEFPYVFICGTAKSFGTKENRNSPKNRHLMFDSDLGIAFNITERLSDDGVTKMYSSLPSVVFSRRYERSVRDEEMMLLYVGLTRAVKKLFITRYTGNSFDKWHNKNIAYINEQGKCDLSVSCGDSFSDWIDTMLHFSDDLVVYAGDTESQEEAEYIKTPPVFDADLSQKLHECFEHYNISADSRSETAAKLTVTQLTHSQETTLPDKTTYRKKSGLTGTARGTAYHSFMQLCDLNALKDADIDVIMQEKKRLETVLTDDELECIENEKILGFARSELFDRIQGTVFRERQFLVRIRDILDENELVEFGISSGESMMQGVADMIFYDKAEDHYVLVDYKTDLNADENELKRRYSDQLKLYAKAFGKILDKPISEAYIYSFEEGSIRII